MTQVKSMYNRQCGCLLTNPAGCRHNRSCAANNACYICYVCVFMSTVVQPKLSLHWGKAKQVRPGGHTGTENPPHTTPTPPCVIFW